MVHISRYLFLTAHVNTMIYPETDALGQWGALSGQHQGNDNETKQLKNVATKQRPWPLYLCCKPHALLFISTDTNC